MTVPVPDCFAKVTPVELSPVTVFSFASLTTAVIGRLAPQVRFVVGDVMTRCVAAPGVMLNAELSVAIAPLVAWRT